MVAGGCVWLGVCMGACVVARGACMVAGGACMVAMGHAWLLGGVRGCQGACLVAGGVFIGHDEIRSMSGQYASYWNAFLFAMQEQARLPEFG